MKTMNILFTQKEKVELREEQIGSPGTGEVLCAADKSLVSIGTELNCLRGIFDTGTNWEEWVMYPFNPGYSMAARVVATGNDVSGYREGDRVAAPVSHNQFFLAKGKELRRIPEGVSYEEASWMTIAKITQLGVRRAEMKLGETVGVIGLGILGQLVVQYLKNMGAGKIIAIDPVQKRLDLAKQNGATHILAMDVKSARNMVEDITDGKMLDIVFDITGHPDVLAPAILLLRRMGRVVLLGDTTTPTQQHLGPGVVSNSISIHGIHSQMYPEFGNEFNPWTKKAMEDLFFDFVIQGRMDVKSLVSHRYSPIEAPIVYEGLLRDRSSAIGIIFDWNML